MVKMAKKLVKKWLIYSTFLSFLFAICSCTVKSCKITPDLEKIGDSALKNHKNLSETNISHAQMTCNY